MATTNVDLQTALLNSLSPTFHTQVPQLARLLTDMVNGILSPAEAQEKLAADSALVSAVEALAGQQIETKHTVLTFGGDYAEGNIDKRNGAFIGDNATVLGTVVGTNHGTIVIGAQPNIPPPPEPNRPPDIEHFVGREADLAYYKEQLTSGHLAMITGMAGVGKTTLAAVLAREVAEPKNIFWHTFHEREGIDVIIWKLAGFLASHGQNDVWQMLNTAQQTGGKPQPPEVLFDYLTQLIHGRGYLICLDDMQFVEEDPLLDQFVERLQGDFLIVAARHIPEIMEEFDSKPLTGLNITETRRLLDQYGLSLSDQLITDLYTQTGGNAQFLILAIAALQRAKDPARLIARLVDADNIEQYLMTEVDKRLSDDERDVMSAVAVLLGYGGTRDAIETVLDGGNIRRVLRELCTRNLLTTNEGEAGKEYGQHAIVQAFYYDALSKRELKAMHHRAGAYYEADGPESDALKAARHFVLADEPAHAATLATNDIWTSINRGHARPLRQLLEGFTARQMDTELWIAVSIARGEIYDLLCEGQLARASYEEALRQLTTLPDTPQVRERKARVCRGIAVLLEDELPQEELQWLHRGLNELAGASALEEALLRMTIGTCLGVTGKYKEASQSFEQSLLLLPEGSNQWRATVLMNMGVIAYYQGENKQAKDYYIQAKDIYQQTFNYWYLVSVWLNLGLVIEIEGDWEDAKIEYQRALQMAEKLGYISYQTTLELNIGNLYTKQGDTDTALEHLSKCLELAQIHDLKADCAAVQSSLADLYLCLKKWTKAETALKEAERFALQLDDKYQLVEIYRGCSQVSLSRGELHAALDNIERSISLARELELDYGEGTSLRVLGQVLFSMDQRSEAMTAFEQSLSLLAEKNPYEAARTKMYWGRALLPSSEADRLLEDARETFARLGAQCDLAELREIENS